MSRHLDSLIARQDIRLDITKSTGLNRAGSEKGR